MKPTYLVSTAVFLFFTTGCSHVSHTIEPKSFLYASDSDLKNNYPKVEQALESAGFPVRTSDLQVGVISAKEKNYDLTPAERAPADKLRVNVNIHQDRNSVKMTVSYLCREADRYRFCSTKDINATDVIDETQKKLDSLMSQALQ